MKVIRTRKIPQKTLREYGGQAKYDMAILGHLRCKICGGSDPECRFCDDGLPKHACGDCGEALPMCKCCRRSGYAEAIDQG